MKRNIIKSFIDFASNIQVESQLQLQRNFVISIGALNNVHYLAEVTLLVRVLKIPGKNKLITPVISFMGRFSSLGKGDLPRRKDKLLKIAWTLSDGQNSDDIRDCLKNVPKEYMIRELVELKEILDLWGEWHSNNDNIRLDIPNEIFEKLNILFGGKDVKINFEGGKNETI